MTRARLVPAALVAMLVTACDSTPEPPPPPPSAAPSSVAGPDGDPATWRLGLDQDIRRSTTSFTALVTRLHCNGGVTGAVLAPAISRTGTQVIVTFEVAARGQGAAQCKGNEPEPYRVDLGEPLQNRALVDGRCLPAEKQQIPVACVGGVVRWKP